jgi:hypothetical protein
MGVRVGYGRLRTLYCTCGYRSVCTSTNVVLRRFEVTCSLWNDGRISDRPSQSHLPLHSFAHQQTRFTTMMKFVVFAILGSLVSSYAPAKSFATRRSTKLRESFGFDFAEDTYKNQPDVLGGEATYKQWVNKIDDNSFLNRKVRNNDCIGAFLYF